jgi:hypothetical protein
MQLAYAVVRSDPPKVFLADDVETLQWVLALEVVARTRPSDLPAGTGDALRDALRAQRWGQAVFEWIEATGTPVDVYPEIKVYEAANVVMGPEELQFTPLFRDAG